MSVHQVVGSVAPDEKLKRVVCRQLAHEHLVEKQLSPKDDAQFKEQLHRIWFELYARKGSSRWVESGNSDQVEISK